ncbi:MAG TPA: hypothetical protein VE913_14435 [Longimicrobium sp.]|nr:hypothetical protein [Longimicrobium sp.]
MTTMGRWLPLAGICLLAAAFAYANRGESMVLHLGLATLYRVPVSVVVFAAFLLGMATMLAIGAREDRRVRRLLRERDFAAPNYPAHRDAAD